MPPSIPLTYCKVGQRMENNMKKALPFRKRQLASLMALSILVFSMFLGISAIPFSAARAPTTGAPMPDVLDQYFPRTESAKPESDLDETIHPNLEAYLKTGVVPDELRSIDSGVEMLITASFEVDFNSLSEHIRIINVYELSVGYLIQGVAFNPKAIYALSALPGVGRVLGNEYNRVLHDKPTDMVTDQFYAREIMGIVDVETEFPGYDGTGVTIGIVDTGVDFGVNDLVDAIDLDGFGQPTSYDPGGSGIAITSHALPSVGGYLLTEGLDFRMFRNDGSLWWSNSTYGIYAENMYVGGYGGIVSQSGIYKVGMSVQIGDALPRLFFVFLLVDSTTPFVYDTVYVDFDTSFAITADYNGVSGGAADWDFTNDAPHMFDNNPILTADLDGDGINDYSMGSLSNTFDLTEQISGDLISGIDPIGRGFAFMFDNDGHGTGCAVASAGRGVTPFEVYANGTEYYLPGAAPGATIMALKTFTILDDMSTWLWGCGYRPIYPDDYPYDAFSYWQNSSGPAADILSNSWGSSTWSVDARDHPWSYDWLSTTMDFLTYDADVLFCVSTGNTGPGYGTGGRPSSTMALMVGASTSSHIWQGFYSNYTQGYDTVADFSSNGPTPQGFSSPDVLAVGAYAFGVGPVQDGDGSDNWGTWGGTSLASPLAAAVAAIAKQGNMGLSASQLRAIVMNGADDLGYDIYRQGAGRVNAYRSLHMAFGNATDGTDNLIQMDTEYTFQTQYEPIRQTGWRAWYLHMYWGWDDGLNFWDYTSYYHPAASGVYDGAVFPQPMYPGDTQSFNISAYDPTGTDVTSVDAYTYALTGEASATLTSSSTYTTFNMTAEFSASFMTDFYAADYAVIHLTYPHSNLESVYGLSSQANYVFLHDWIEDTNGNGVVDFEGGGTAGEVRRISSDTAYGNSHTINLGFPGTHFWGDPTIYYHDVGVELFLWRTLDVNVTVRLFDRVPWAWVSTSKYGADPTTWDVTVNVPGGTDPGFYEGYLEATYGTGATQMPMSLSVNYNMTAPGAAGTYTWGGSTDTPYDNGATYGNIQWGYRQQVGDWRFYFVDCYPTAEYVSYIMVNVTWSDPDTRLDVMCWLTGYGYNWMESDNIWEGGRFVGDETWPRQNVLLVDVTQSSIGSWITRGVLGIAIRTSEFGGSTGGPEDFWVTVSYGVENGPFSSVMWDLPYVHLNATDRTRTWAEITENSTWFGPHVEFKANWSPLVLAEFPTIEIRQTTIELLAVTTDHDYGTIVGPVIGGWNPDLNPREDYAYFDVLGGMSVEITTEFGTWSAGEDSTLIHGPADDCDIFVWAPGVAHTYANSLTGGQTATGANPEFGIFTAPISGEYTVGIDYYSGVVPMGWTNDIYAFSAVPYTEDGDMCIMDTTMTGTNAAYDVRASFTTGTSLDYGSTAGFSASRTVPNVTFTNFFAPEITSLEPNGGEVLGYNPFQINWTAFDENAAIGDEIIGFSVEVSNDSGLTWKIITFGTTLNSIVWDPYSSYYGLTPTNQMLVRVNATDGRYVTSRTSAAVFTVEAKIILPTPPYELYVVIGVAVIVIVILLITCLLKRRQTSAK
ncbi:MAG: S8 family serine peptidase [Candidatus Hodarchaeota archaeon]